jgi:hypothetical protein
MLRNCELSSKPFARFRPLRFQDSRKDIRGKESNADMLGVAQDDGINAVDTELASHPNCSLHGSGEICVCDAISSLHGTAQTRTSDTREGASTL